MGNPEEKPLAGRGGYVEEDTYENQDEQASRGGGGGGITAIALYDYQAQADDEISFDPNDIISNIEMVDNDWWAGVLRGVRGMFPANFVQLLDSSVLPPTMDTTTPIEELYDTMYEEEDTYESMGDQNNLIQYITRKKPTYGRVYGLINYDYNTV